MTRSRKKRIQSYRLIALTLLAATALVAAVWVARTQSSGRPDDRLWRAIVAVESSGNPLAYNPTTGATGIAQIREICVDDCNRIARQQGLDDSFTYADRRRPGKSREMWNIYLTYYGQEYRRQTGRRPTDEVFARIWNGGPTGWTKPSTEEYWQKVHQALRG
jgi:hypothetical protein